jgi:uncharacterized RmlC-like cupin family protein
MNRAAAVNLARVGAQKIWARTLHIYTDARTDTHDHGHLESIIYVLKGKGPDAIGREAEVHDG